MIYNVNKCKYIYDTEYNIQYYNCKKLWYLMETFLLEKTHTTDHSSTSLASASLNPGF